MIKNHAVYIPVPSHSELWNKSQEIWGTLVYCTGFQTLQKWVGLIEILKSTQEFYYWLENVQKICFKIQWLGQNIYTKQS